MRRLVAEHADIWHSFVDPAEMPHKLDVLARWADKEGRDLSGLVLSNELGHRDVVVVEIGAVLGAHVGPGMVGVAVAPHV